MKSTQDQMLEELLQAPLSKEGFDRLLAILEQRQRAGLAGKPVFENSLKEVD